MFKYLNDNLNGYFRWSKYIKYGTHDRKFGPNFADYLCQIPVIGIFGWISFYILLVCISALLVPLEIYWKLEAKINERKKKSDS